MTRHSAYTAAISLLLAATTLGQDQVPDPTPLIYSAYLGGAVPAGLAVDSAGAAYVVGRIQTNDLPTTPGAVQPEFTDAPCLILGFGGAPSRAFPCDDVFVLKMNPSGTEVEYATYLGGTSIDTGIDLAVDQAGAMYVLAQTQPGLQNQRGLPVTAGVVQPESRGIDAWVGKLSPSGQLVWGTYLGGASVDQPTSIAVDPQGSVYVAGTTASLDFPTTANSIQGARSNQGDAFVTKLSPDGSEIVYSTFLGGTATETAQDIAVDVDGSASVVGSTRSKDFPVTPSALQAVNRSVDFERTAFVSRISPDGSTLVFSTFLGGSMSEEGQAIALDRDGNVIVAGLRLSDDFPFTDGALQLDGGGFLAKLSPAGDRLLLGADPGGTALGLSADPQGNIYLTGNARRTLPTTPGAVQPCGKLAGSDRKGFAAKVNPGGTELLYSTFLSVHLAGRGRAVAAGPDGSIYVTGQVNDREFPATPSSPFLIDGTRSALLARIASTDTPPHPYPSQVRNGASFRSGAVSPGAWVTIFNPSVGPQEPVIGKVDENGAAPTTLADTRVLFNGIPGIITYAHHCQVNAIAPFGIEGAQQAEIVVEFQATRSTPVRLPVAATTPGIYTRGSLGFGNAAALNQDLSINGPDRLAPLGSIVALFGTGAGRLSPPLSDGEIAQGAQHLIAAETLIQYRDRADQQWRDAEVTYAGAAPGLLAGLIQINFRVPADFVSLGRRPFENRLVVRWTSDGLTSGEVGVWVEPE